jgi:diguanylate cyclase
MARSIRALEIRVSETSTDLPLPPSDAVAIRWIDNILMPKALWVRVMLLVSIFCLNSVLVIAASEYTGGLAAFWSANACLLFALMLSPRRQHIYYMIGAFSASVATNFVMGSSSQTAFAYSLSNIVEAWAAYYAMTRLGLPRAGLYQPRQLWKFACVAIAVSLLSATMSLLGVTSDYYTAWLSWFGSDLLGLLVFLPCLNILYTPAQSTTHTVWPGIRRAEFAAILVLNIASSFLALGQSYVPLMFLPTLTILLAVFRFGAQGAVTSTLLIAVVAETCLLLGRGPIAQFQSTEMVQMFLLQGFVAWQLLSALPIASILADRESKAKDLIESERLLRMAAQRTRREAEVNWRKHLKLVTTDELTGLFSRRRINEKLDRIKRQCQAQNNIVPVAIFDIDRFKAINDTHGHLIGDDMLRMIARIVKQNAAPGVSIGRIGGEEFLMLMPGMSVFQAKRQVEHLRKAIMAARLDGTNIGATISVGISTVTAQKTLKETMASADAALYQAKNDGRNRLEIAA